jgi:hypothetical protein
MLLGFHSLLALVTRKVPSIQVSNLISRAGLANLLIEWLIQKLNLDFVVLYNLLILRPAGVDDSTNLARSSSIKHSCKNRKLRQ